MATYATREYDVLNLVIANKDEMEVAEIILMEYASATLGSIKIKNMLAIVRYLNLDIVFKADVFLIQTKRKLGQKGNERLTVKSLTY